MAIQRSQLVRGPAIVTTTLNTLRTLYTAGDINLPLEPNWTAVPTSAYGRVDDVLKDRVYKFGLRLWGAWENLDLLFPSYALAPAVGTSLFGNTNNGWNILGKNGDQIAYKNAQITKLANLFLGVDENVFAADVEVTALIGNDGANNLLTPETANAYYTASTNNAYADGAFSKANFKRNRFTGNWNNLAGFSAVAPQKGFQVAWELDLKAVPLDGYGTVDFTIGENGLIGTCSCIAVQPTIAQLEAQASAQGVAIGSLLSALAADLTLTGNGGSPVITLKSAGIVKHGYMFGIDPLRLGPMQWKTTRGFTAGAPNAVATVA